MKLKTNLDKKPESDLPPAVVVTDSPPVYDEKPPGGFKDAPVIAQHPVAIKQGVSKKKVVCLVLLGVVLLGILIAVPVVLVKKHHKHRHHHTSPPPDYVTPRPPGGQGGDHKLKYGTVKVSNGSNVYYAARGAVDFKKGIAALSDEKLKRCYFIKMPFSSGDMFDSHEEDDDHFANMLKMTYIYGEDQITERSLVLRTCKRAYDSHWERLRLGKEILEFCGRHSIFEMNVYKGRMWDAARKTYILRRDRH
eukprot:GHVR01064397.1.p1 GENE.GHVR01064397.1~~GHVR01064397.1.p1  ORF type:complete len:250 (+),score=20.28 GHVR01064397.1:102-851(+)